MKNIFKVYKGKINYKKGPKGIKNSKCFVF